MPKVNGMRLQAENFHWDLKFRYFAIVKFAKFIIRI